MNYVDPRQALHGGFLIEFSRKHDDKYVLQERSVVSILGQATLLMGLPVLCNHLWLGEGNLLLFVAVMFLQLINRAILTGATPFQVDGFRRV